MNFEPTRYDTDEMDNQEPRRAAPRAGKPKQNSQAARSRFSRGHKGSNSFNGVHRRRNKRFHA